jgi:replicative DNA helicase
MNEEPEESIDNLPPHSMEAERGILGCCLLDPIDVLTECAEKIPSVELFYDLRHRRLYETLMEMVNSGIRIDMVTLVNRLKERDTVNMVGGVEYISGHMNAVPSAANLSFYVDIALEQYTRRKIIACAVRAKIGAVSAAATETILGQFESEAMAIRDHQEMKAVTGRSISEIFMTDGEDAHQRQGKIAGISYGLPQLDYMTGGMHVGELVVIAARPSIGKTALGGSICLATAFFADIPVPTLFITLESSAKAIVRRLGCGLAEFSIGHFRSGRFQDRDFKPIASAAARMSKAPLWIEQHLSGITAAKVRAIIRFHARKHGVKVVIVDYLQKVRPDTKGEKRTYDIAQVSEALKAEAEASNVAVIALAQLNRDAEEYAQPKLSHLRDSGSIEQDADQVLLIHRLDKSRTNKKRDEDEQERDHNTLLLLEKQRNGPTGPIKLMFDADYTLFRNVTAKIYSNSEEERQK